MSKKALHHIASRVLNRPLLLEPGYARTFFSALKDRLGIAELRDGIELIDSAAEIADFQAGSELTDRGASRSRKPYHVDQGIAIIPVEGTLVHKYGSLEPYSGMTGYDGILANVEIAAGDAAVQGILLDFDSPGGEVSGCFDTARSIRDIARDSGKVVAASCNEMNCSAAMALASAADVRFITETGMAGSVGVVMAHTSIQGWLDSNGTKVTLIHSGKHKVDGNPYEDLPDEVLEKFQAETDELRDDFAELVADFIGIDKQAVLDTEAAVFTGQKAIDVGIADLLINGNDAVDVFANYLSEQGSSIISIGGSTTMAKPAEKQTKTEGNDAEQATATTQASAAAAPGSEAAAQPAASAGEQSASEARSAERERISSILGADEAVGRHELASYLAYDTDLTVDQAVSMLAKAPQGATATAALDKAMSATEQPGIGADSDLAGEQDSTVSNLMSSYQKATGKALATQ